MPQLDEIYSRWRNRRDMLVTVWFDPIEFEWTDEEREFLAEDASSRWLLGQQPPIVAKVRPPGGVRARRRHAQCTLDGHIPEVESSAMSTAVHTPSV